MTIRVVELIGADKPEEGENVEEGAPHSQPEEVIRKRECN